MEIKTHNQKGAESGKVSLTDNVFDLPWNGDLVHQVLVSLQSNARVLHGVAKDRSEVSGGGKKPWRQKGTGRARHGSNRSPIWIGGGVTHGPRREQNFSKKINRKMKNKALLTAFSAKIRDNEVLFVDAVDMDSPKTKDAREILHSWGKAFQDENVLSKEKNSVKVLTFEENENLKKSLQNIKNVDVADIKNINLLDILSYKYVVVVEPENSVAFLEKKMA